MIDKDVSYFSPFPAEQIRNSSTRLHKQKCYGKALYAKFVLLCSIDGLRYRVNGDLVMLWAFERVCMTLPSVNRLLHNFLTSMATEAIASGSCDFRSLWLAALLLAFAATAATMALAIPRLGFRIRKFVDTDHSTARTSQLPMATSG